MKFQCNFTSDSLKQMLKNNKSAAEWWPFLSEILPDFQITSKVRVAAFMSQCAHESGEFRALQENLNYSAESLQQTFPRYFPTFGQAQEYARQPERIANRVYANRMGNGDERSGDGWRYRGRGLIQLTGRSNYAQCSRDLYEDSRLIDEPDRVSQMPGAIYSACWFWHRNRLNAIADTGNVETLTRRINGGVNGLDHRRGLYLRYLDLL